MLVYANKVKLKWSSQWAIKAILQLANVAAMCMITVQQENLVSIKFDKFAEKGGLAKFFIWQVVVCCTYMI